jgi:predicted hydrocarbon binding protein
MSVKFSAFQYYDSEKARQYLNGVHSVLHCHHYTALFSQLADDAKLLNGPKLLADAAEEMAHDVLKDFFEYNKVENVNDRKTLVESHFSYVGLGKLKIELENESGSAVMESSHVDESWIKKWGNREQPVNYIGQGFLAGAFSAIFSEEINSFQVEEIESIVSGAERSTFKIIKKIEE